MKEEKRMSERSWRCKLSLTANSLTLTRNEHTNGDTEETEERERRRCISFSPPFFKIFPLFTFSLSCLLTQDHRLLDSNLYSFGIQLGKRQRRSIVEPGYVRTKGRGREDLMSATLRVPTSLILTHIDDRNIKG